MAQVSVTLNTDNPFEATLLLQLSMACAAPHRDAVRRETTGAQPEVAPPCDGSVTPATPAAEPLGANPGGDGVVSGAGVEASSSAPAAAADVKPKRGRKAAAESTAEPEQPVAQAEPETPATPDISIDDIRTALSAYTQRHDLNAGIELLKQFGATRVSAVKEADYAGFLEACRK